MKIIAKHRLAASRQQSANKLAITLINDALGVNFNPSIYAIDGTPAYDRNVQYSVIAYETPSVVHSKLLKVVKQLKTELDEGYYDTEYQFADRFAIDFWSYIISMRKSKDVPGTLVALEIYSTGMTKEEQLEYYGI